MGYFNTHAYDAKGFNQAQSNSNSSLSANMSGAATVAASLGGTTRSIDTNYYSFIGMLNTVPLNRMALNRAIVSSSMSLIGGTSSMTASISTSKAISANMSGSGDIVPPDMARLVVIGVTVLPRVNVLNSLPLNTGVLNGATPGVYMSGSSDMRASLVKSLSLSMSVGGGLGVLNTTPLNSLPLNSAISKTNGGSSTMTVTFGGSVVRMSANMNGSVYVGGPGGTTQYYRNGGYNSSAFREVPYREAKYVVSTTPGDSFIGVGAAQTLSAIITGSGDIAPLPWLQSYNSDTISNGRRGVAMRGQRRAVYLRGR